MSTPVNDQVLIYTPQLREASVGEFLAQGNCDSVASIPNETKGTNSSMTSQFREENDVCVVSVAVGNSLVQNIDVIDIDGSVVGQVNAPRFHSPSQSMKVLGVCLATAGCVLILILLLKVVRV